MTDTDIQLGKLKATLNRISSTPINSNCTATEVMQAALALYYLEVSQDTSNVTVRNLNIIINGQSPSKE